MKVYITNHALTDGIIEKEVNQDCGNPKMVYVVGQTLEYYHGNDWHVSLASAIARADEMRLKKIESLKKSLKKMESLKFQ